MHTLHTICKGTLKKGLVIWHGNGFSISIQFRMVVLMESGTKTNLYEPVSKIACVCVSFVLVLNIHIPLYLGSRRKPFFRTCKFFLFFSSSFNYKVHHLPELISSYLAGDNTSSKILPATKDSTI